MNAGAMAVPLRVFDEAFSLRAMSWQPMYAHVLAGERGQAEVHTPEACAASARIMKVLLSLGCQVF